MEYNLLNPALYFSAIPKYIYNLKKGSVREKQFFTIREIMLELGLHSILDCTKSRVSLEMAF
jgi:hypothetical protein